MEQVIAGAERPGEVRRRREPDREDNGKTSGEDRRVGIGESEQLTSDQTKCRADDD